MTGDTIDISNLAEFEWYEYVYYITPASHDSLANKRLGRYLGPSFDVGEAMCMKVLNSNAKNLSRTLVFPISEEELRSAKFKEKKEAFEKELAVIVGQRDLNADDGFEVESTDDRESVNPQDPDYETPL